VKRIVIGFLAVAFLFPMAIMAEGTKEAANKEVVLKWPCIWVGKDTKAPEVAKLVDEFNAANAGKIKVEIESQPDYDGYEQKIRTSIAAGMVPDIFTIKLNPTTAEYYKSDLLMDFSSELTGAWKDSFKAGTLDQATIGGALKSIPYEIAITPIWYNEDLLKKAGVSYPKTVDEMWTVFDKLKAAGITPASQMTGGTNAWTSMLWFSHFAASLGGPKVWDKPLTDPVFVKAAALLKRMYENNNTTPDAIGGNAGVAGGYYLTARTAFFSNGPWYIGRVKTDAPAVFAATKVAPAPAAGPYKDAMIGFLQANIAAANTKDPAKKAAELAFLQWMTKPENVKRIALNSGAMFAVKFNLTPQDTVDPLMKQFYDLSDASAFNVMHLEGARGAEVVAEFGQQLGKMALGQSTPEEFMKAVAAKEKR
jgi:raffinose/stachyose/melibiose transport system substrate-binding protein